MEYKLSGWVAVSKGAVKKNPVNLNDTKNDLPTFLIPMYLELKRRDSHKDLIPLCLQNEPTISG